MSDVDFDTKLKVAARAFFRDGQGDPEYPHRTWQQQYEELKGSVSPKFIETCYELNKDDPDLNPEINSDLN